MVVWCMGKNKQIDSFRGTTLEPNLNRRMKPLHLLLTYLDGEGEAEGSGRLIRQIFIIFKLMVDSIHMDAGAVYRIQHKVAMR